MYHNPNLEAVAAAPEGAAGINHTTLSNWLRKPSGGVAGLCSSSRHNPCPICGRAKDGDCRTSPELVICHHGSSHHPPAGLAIGEVITGQDGRRWAFTGDTADGRAATFTPDKPRQQQGRNVAGYAAEPEPFAFTLARLPQPAAEPPASWSHGHRLTYAHNQRVEVAIRNGEKAFYPWHRDAAGDWSTGKGLEPWPLWQQPEALTYGAGRWITEAEGEKCAEWLRAGGLVAISQPGHDHTASSIERRYRALVAAGVAGVAYLADNDSEGQRKADRCAAAAAAVGLPLVVLPAAEVWPGLPDKGSIDDAPGTALERAVVLEVAAGQAAWRYQPPQTEAGQQPEPGPPKDLSFEDRWSLLEARADEIAATSWTTMKATAALAAAATELELSRLGTRQLEQLLEAAQRRRRATAKPITGGGVFTIQATPWAVEGLFRHGLNLLVGQPGSGKSRLAAACIAAWLRGDQTWLDLPMPCTLPVEQRHALIIGTDQPLEDWAITLEPVGLVERLSATEVRLHPRLTLYQLEAGAQLDADTLASIRRWSDQHPGCPVLADSLAALLPPGIEEDKASAAKPVYGLQEAIGTGWAILTHHTRKAAGKEGNIGVGAGRGSSSIDGAVSRVIGLGLIHKMEGGVMTPQEADPRRELLSTKRGGATLHLVVRSDGNGHWSNEGSAEDLKRQERKERTLAGLTEAQSAVMAVLDDSGDWITGRQVAEGLLEPGDEYDARGAKAAAIRKVLKRLEVLGLIETKRVGLEKVYRLTGQAPQGVSQVSQSLTHEVEKTGSNGSPTAAQGISVAHPMAHTGSHWLTPCAATGEPVRAIGEPVGEPVRPTAPQGVSQVSQCPSRVVHSTGSPTGSPPPAPGLPVTVEGEEGWVVPGGRIPKAGNVLAVGPDGRSHHVAVIGVKPALRPPAAPAPAPASTAPAEPDPILFDDLEGGPPTEAELLECIRQNHQQAGRGEVAA